MVIYCEPWQRCSKRFQMESPVTIPLSSDAVQQNLHHVHVRRPYPEVPIAKVCLGKHRQETLNMLTPRDI